VVSRSRRTLATGRPHGDRAPGAEVGPESLLWRWAGDSRIAYLGATIGLLQTMHPAVGAGLVDHSDFFDDPVDRVFRSLPEILGTVYDADGAATGRAVRDAHRRIRGDDDGHGRPYHALDPETFWWAHATFQFMVEQVADRFDRHRLTPGEREQLYQEGVTWYRRYGVSDRAVPATRAQFQEAWDHLCDHVLERNEATDFVLETLRGPMLPAFEGRAPLPRHLHRVADTRLVRRALVRPARLVAIGGLPARLRDRLGIAWSRHDQYQLTLFERTVARTHHLAPASMRWQPRAQQGWRRETGSLP
jgi:uncharacterized protein (DUF2236 family)